MNAGATARRRAYRRPAGSRKRLEGILPTCMYCKKIRDEQSSWVSIENYISQRTEASFSHGVCPTCYNEVVKPELDRLLAK